MKTKSIFGSAVGAFLGLAASSLVAQTFVDGTFNDADWSVVLLPHDQPNATFTASQSASGGNPGTFRLLTYESLNAGTVNAANLRSGAFYTPSIQGALASVSFSYDLQSVSLTVFSAPYFAPLLVQGGNYYRWNQLHINTLNPWRTFAANDLTASDFFLFGGSLGDHPDFSVNGAPMQFGFATIDGLSTGGRNVAGIDNWSVTAVPEPSVYALGFCAVFTWWCLRRLRNDPAA